MPIELFGGKATSWFDIWSLVHFVSGLAISSFFFDFVKRKLPNGIQNPHSINILGHCFYLWLDTLLIICFAYSWEFIELFLEKGLLGSNVMFWFNGIEFPANRFLTDPLLTYLGYKLGRSFYFQIVHDPSKNIIKTHMTPLFFKNNMVSLKPAYLPCHTSIISLKGGACLFLVIWTLINVSLPHSMHIQSILIR